MPIFHDPQESLLAPAPNPQALASGQSRAGSPHISPERPLLDSLLSPDATSAVTYRNMEPDSPNQSRKLSGADRLELIERLKRVQSPPRHLQQSNELQRDARSESPLHRNRPKTPLSHGNDVKASRTTTPEPARDAAAIGLAIERPRSALHSGDFRVDKGRDSPDHGSSSTFLATSPVVPWNQSFPAAALPAQRNETPFAFKFGPSDEARAVSRARAISQSSITPFALLPPTSPLVHQANNTDLDFSSRPTSRQNSKSPERNNRRHTFSPSSFQSYSATQMARSTSGTPAARHIRYGSSIPYQAHQPRRSITNLSQSQSNPPTPYLGSRRPSISSEASPLQHAPMVGSYEESILRGRMSTTPSRPLDFVAKIGVLGKGQCKASLKCPPHVTVPFPAVFYSYNTGNGRISDNEPSPYVGLIDLENSLPPPVENDNGKRKRRHAVPSPDRDDFDFRIAREPDFRKQEKRKRRSTSPKAPPGGCYRIPAQGQLQVVLKNPNKTAVKLFLVPYDLSDMEPGQKTFIRQRSYSAGPIIDMPTSSRKNLGTDRPEAALSNSDDPKDRPILRYLIHLHICCPSKGRFYLYKSIRVVFANRVPDGKEKLRNEIQLPEPKYSAYKPSREQGPSSFTAQLNAEKALRRRSAGWPLSHSQRSYDQIDGLTQHRPPLPPPALQFTGGPLIPSSASSGFSSPMPDLQAIPFNLTRLAAIESRPVSREQMDIDPTSPFRTPVASPKSMGNSPLNSDTATTFEKRSPGEAGYGGTAFSPLGSPGAMPSAGLLSRRLRGLDVQKDDES